MVQIGLMTVKTNKYFIIQPVIFFNDITISTDIDNK